MPAKGKIEVGDKIISADGKNYQSAEKLIDYISSKKAGDKVTLKIEREEKEKRVTLTLKQFPDEPDRAGIGVSLYTDRNVKVEPDIDFEIENIGGTSAGLMMSLEIYNQLTKSDETKGYDIAGTGTIDVDGKVYRSAALIKKSSPQTKPEKTFSSRQIKTAPAIPIIRTQ